MATVANDSQKAGIRKTVTFLVVFVVAAMVNIQRFGLLTVLVVVLALLIDLIFVPALLRTFYGHAGRER